MNLSYAFLENNFGGAFFSHPNKHEKDFQNRSTLDLADLANQMLLFCF
uniref:Macaca fascicularis brain cDNA, clone: QflA-20682 n=1 Tax=Macaca fascicularis TaxID=9541 RepID=I7GNE9_MACFA|nr:unnamed protein product [Macaca fascicularis]